MEMEKQLGEAELERQDPVGHRLGATMRSLPLSMGQQSLGRSSEETQHLQMYSLDRYLNHGVKNAMKGARQDVH